MILEDTKQQLMKLDFHVMGHACEVVTKRFNEIK